MTKYLQIVVFMLCVFSLCGQSYFTDFEEFEAGEYIAEESPYWSVEGSPVTEGSTEDAQIVDTHSKPGGKNSIKGTNEDQLYIQATFLDFGQTFSTGLLKFYFSIYVPKGKLAPLRLYQILQTTRLNYASLNFNSDNSLSINSYAKGVTQFKNDEWIDIEMMCDYDNDILTVLMNGEVAMVLKGKVSTANFMLKSYVASSANEGNTEYYIDNIGFEHFSESPSYTTELMIGNSEGEFGIVGVEKTLSNKIINKGEDYNGQITVNATYGNQTISENLGNIEILAGEEHHFSFTDKINISKGVIPIEINIDPSGDEDKTNNTLISNLLGVETVPDKVVLIETALRNQIGFFPYSLVYLPRIKDQFGDHVAIVNVHENGVLSTKIYSQWIGEKRIQFNSGFQSMFIDRAQGVAVGSDWVGRTASFIDNEPSATFEITMVPTETGSFNGTAFVKINALKDIPSDYKVSLMLAENNVNKNALGYEAANSYADSNSSFGEMGGYEKLTNPIPASDMFYNNLAREIYPEGDGLPLGIALAAGETLEIPFKYSINEEWNPLQMSVIAALHTANGSTDNAKKITFEEAGFFVGNKNIYVNNDLHIYPNPTNGNAVIELKYDEATDVQLSIFDMTGKSIMNKTYKNITGHHFIDLRNLHLNNGIYSVVLKTESTLSTQKLMVR